jgi:hypothetical protein
VPVGTRGSDIDHVVIGPSGVFTLNTKHHPDAKIWVGPNAFLVNGHQQPYLRNSRHEAARATALLTAGCDFDVPVTSLIIAVGADLTIRTAASDVTVLGRRDLTAWLKSQPNRLDDPTIARIHNAARRPATWTSS